jgi:anaerobic magnesium-protoporphyrin IX monomethyl ester cyclase
MMRLLLTHAYFLAEDVKEQRIMKPYPPLGLLYLSSHLRNSSGLRDRSFECDIYDSTFGTRQELSRLLEEGPPGVLGLYVNLMTRTSALEIAGHARAAGWLVMLGGPEPANYGREYLTAGADLIVAGEGEIAVERLALANFEAAAWASIPGLIFLNQQGELVETGPAQLLPNLDAQPWPDRERIDIPQYLRTWRTHHGMGSISVITARGCPYRCNWCSHSVYGHTHRRRSAKAVVDEVEWALKRYGPEMLWIADDVFTIHHGWLAEYASEMKRRSIRIPFECITRADRLNERAAALLAELGCMRVWIGSESGSQRILDAMERGVTVEQVQRAIALSRRNGIQTGMFLMWGYDGEELSDIEATVAHVKSCRPDIFFTTVSYPIKGTPYFEKVRERLVAIEPWAQSTDRNFAISGRHSRAFYKHADELLRSEMAPTPDAVAIQSARQALQSSSHEVEV